MRETSKKNSIYLQLLQLLVVSAIVSAFAFLVLNYAGEYIIDQVFYSSNYEQKKNKSQIRELQQYVDQYEIGARDTKELIRWTKKQKMISINVYQDDILVFDSEYPNIDMWEQDIHINEYDWQEYYDVQFADGPAKVEIWGSYIYQFYSYAVIAELVLSFALFLVLVLRGIRGKMDYILQLSEEIEILEGGSLDYEITIKGKDELAALAEGLDHMRRSFQKLIEQETQMMLENQKIVTEMSHDIRTPITSIMLYIEIIKKGTYKDQKQWMQYIEKIEQKATRMKQLTDHLFEYSLVTGGEISMEKEESYEVLFYDLFSETCSYLQQQGFRTVFQVQWIDRELQVYTDYIIRIMDNITSNIVKYADPNEAIVIRSVYNGKTAGFSFENHIRDIEENVESTQVGIQSIKSMMLKMNGFCQVYQEKEIFRIEICFPCVNKKESLERKEKKGSYDGD